MTTSARVSVPPKPKALPVIPDGIPDELKALRRWVLWRWEQRDGKWTKPPYQSNGQHADSTRLGTWCSFLEALAAYEHGRFDGIGYVVTEEDGIVGVDLDHCRNSETGTVEPWAMEIVSALGSYTEVTPSGTGLRVFLYGELPPNGRKSGNVEMYDQGRYLTVTGHHLDGTPQTIEERTEALVLLHAEVFLPKETPTHVALAPINLEDADLLRKAFAAANGAAFRRLWEGDTSAYSSPSEADAALASRLWFWSGGDAEQVKRLLLQSGLAREKTARPDYLERTVRLVAQGEVYSPRRQMRGHRAVRIPAFEVQL